MLTIELQGVISEKEAEIRASLARLDDAVNSSRPLSSEDIATLRRQLEDTSSMVLEQSQRSKQVSEENEILARRKDELESRLSALESEYEELLDKTIAEDELADRANVQDIKVNSSFLFPRRLTDSCMMLQSKLETQYAMKLEASINDGVDLKQQLELKAQENKNLATSLSSLREANSELEVRRVTFSSPYSTDQRFRISAGVQDHCRRNRRRKESRRVCQGDGASTQDDGRFDGRV